MKRLLQSPRTQSVIAWLAARYLLFVSRTTRWRLDGTADLAAFAAGPPGIVVFWHETLPHMPILWRHLRTGGKPATVLASRHRDGQLIGKVTQNLGLNLVSGSTSRGGAAGLRALAAALQSGHNIGLTPDGPRGPPRQAAPGAAQLAALTGAPILCAAARIAWAIPLNSWDRMRFPLPFGPGALSCAAPFLVTRQDWPAGRQTMEARLNAALHRALTF